MSHTEEPWNFDTYDGITHITDSNNNLAIARLTSYGGVYGASESNARRIVACINACAGVSTEYLEGFAVGVNATGIPIDKVMELLNNERDTYRDLCGDLLVELLGLYENVSSEIHKEHRDLVKSVITKAESILGEKNG